MLISAGQRISSYGIPYRSVVYGKWRISNRLAGKVTNNRQFDDLVELKECMIYEWEKLSENLLKTLATSMRRRVLKVISKQGPCIQ